MNIEEAHEYALCLSSDIARINSKHPMLKRYFGSVWEEIDAKEKAYEKLSKRRLK